MKQVLEGGGKKLKYLKNASRPILVETLKARYLRALW